MRKFILNNYYEQIQEDDAGDMVLYNDIKGKLKGFPIARYEHNTHYECMTEAVDGQYVMLDDIENLLTANKAENALNNFAQDYLGEDWEDKLSQEMRDFFLAGYNFVNK